MERPHSDHLGGACGACHCDAQHALAPNVAVAAGAAAQPLAEQMPARPHATSWLRIPAMDCATEEGDIRRALSALPGVQGLRFRLGSRALGIDASAEVVDQAVDAIARAGYKSSRLAGEPAAVAHRGHDAVHSTSTCDDHCGHTPAVAAGEGRTERGMWPREELRYGAALVLACIAEGWAYAVPSSLAGLVAGMAVAAAAIALAGFSTYAKGLAALRRGRIGINALMTVAVTGAFVIGQWPEAAMVMALYAIAEWIEARSVDRARHAIQGLLSLTPEVAEVRAADGAWVSVPVVTVQPGQTVRIKPGARVPLDATVVVGVTTVDASAVTGESLPVERSAGQALFAGTVNLTGTVEAVATAASDNTLLARIIHAVEQAQGSRAPTQAFIDRFAAVYTPAVFGIAVAVALLGPLIMGWPWLQGIYKALVLLVIACPCALVISTPVTIVSGLAAAARRGIVIKGGAHLENARHISVVALDKTGTVTQGQPALVALEVLANDLPGAEVLHWASDMAAHSDHPVSQAIAAGLAGQGCDGDLAGFEALPGQGVRAQAHGQTLWLGNHRLIEALGVCTPAIESRLATHEALGRSTTLLANQERVLALFAVADAIKPHSREAVQGLATLGVTVVMLSGDNPATVKAIADQSGIAQARGNLMPQDKLTAVAEWKAAGARVAMVGDGINDAPALAASDLGVAMGGAGTDIAIEAADMVIMNDDLRRIPEAIALSRRVHTVLLQNVALALGIKAVFLVLALLGAATMWMAVFADMGASLLVVANGLRLTRQGAAR